MENKNVFLVSLCVILVTSLCGCSIKSAASEETQSTPVVVENTVIAEGHLVPKTSTWLSFQTSGRVEEVLVEEGEEIIKGQALILLSGSDRAESELTAAKSALFLAEQNFNDTKESDALRAAAELELDSAQRAYDDLKVDYEYYEDHPDDDKADQKKAELDIARARLDDTQRNYDRLEDGYSKESLAQLQAALDQAQAAVDNAQWAYDQLTLVAPYDGVFTRCDLTVGDFIAAGQNAALVADFSEWWIETSDLDEIEVTQIDETKEVSILADALPEKEFSGMVDQISQYYTDDNGDILYTVSVKMDDNDDQLRWGMTVQLKFEKK